jgi:hypothetical protein
LEPVVKRRVGARSRAGTRRRLVLAILWSALVGLSAIWVGLAGEIPTWLYVTGGIGVPVLLALGKFTKQPGLD